MKRNFHALCRLQAGRKRSTNTLKHFRAGKSQTFFLTNRAVKDIIIHTESTHQFGGDYYVYPTGELGLILILGINLTQSSLLLW